MSNALRLLGILILIAPPLSVVALARGARILSRGGASRAVVSVTSVLAAIAGLVLAVGYVRAVLVTVRQVGNWAGQPSEKARLLGEGISLVMNAGASAVLIALVGAGWFGYWRARQRRVS